MFKSHAATAITGLFALGLVVPAFAATSGETQEQTALQGTNLALTQAINNRRAARHSTRARESWTPRTGRSLAATPAG